MIPAAGARAMDVRSTRIGHALSRSPRLKELVMISPPLPPLIPPKEEDSKVIVYPGKLKSNVYVMLLNTAVNYIARHGRANNDELANEISSLVKRKERVVRRHVETVARKLRGIVHFEAGELSVADWDRLVAFVESLYGATLSVLRSAIGSLYSAEMVRALGLDEVVASALRELYMSLYAVAKAGSLTVKALREARIDVGDKLWMLLLVNLAVSISALRSAAIAICLTRGTERGIERLVGAAKHEDLELYRLATSIYLSL